MDRYPLGALGVLPGIIARQSSGGDFYAGEMLKLAAQFASSLPKAKEPKAYNKPTERRYERISCICGRSDGTMHKNGSYYQCDECYRKG